MERRKARRSVAEFVRGVARERGQRVRSGHSARSQPDQRATSVCGFRVAGFEVSFVTSAVTRL